MDLMSMAQLLGNFGEFVGAIAVVGTLVYLAIQVKQSKESLDANTQALDRNQTLTRADMLYRLSDRWDETMYRATENREIASIFASGNKNFDNLDETDREIFRARIAFHFNAHYQWHRMVADGFLEPEYLAFVDQDLRENWGSTEGARRIWKDQLQHLFPHSDHVNSLLDG